MSTFVTITLRAVTCYKCSITFGIESDHLTRLKRTHETFWCPNGHAQTFTGKSDLEREREARESAERNSRFWLEQHTQEQAMRIRTERRLIAQKGATTRLKHRAAAGTCPCCHRTFQALSRHMQHKHPEFVKSVKPEAAS